MWVVHDSSWPLEVQHFKMNFDKHVGESHMYINLHLGNDWMQANTRFIPVGILHVNWVFISNLTFAFTFSWCENEQINIADIRHDRKDSGFYPSLKCRILRSIDFNVRKCRSINILKK